MNGDQTLEQILGQVSYDKRQRIDKIDQAISKLRTARDALFDSVWEDQFRALSRAGVNMLTGSKQKDIKRMIRDEMMNIPFEDRYYSWEEIASPKIREMHAFFLMVGKVHSGLPIHRVGHMVIYPRVYHFVAVKRIQDFSHYCFVFIEESMRVDLKRKDCTLKYGVKMAVTISLLRSWHVQIDYAYIARTLFELLAVCMGGALRNKAGGLIAIICEYVYYLNSDDPLCKAFSRLSLVY